MALSTLLDSCPAISLVSTASTIAEATRNCEMELPDAVIFDVSFPNNEAFEAGTYVIDKGLVRAVGFLDNDESFAKARRAMAVPRAAYFTRHNALREISSELRRLAQLTNSGLGHDRRISRSDPRHAQLAKLDKFGLLSLTAREEEVLCWLVRGLSVKEAAAQLGLSESTVDNHKTRLMKKLKSRRATELMRIAMRAGLVD